MENQIRTAKKRDLFRLTQLYEKNGLSPVKTVCDKSVNCIEKFMLDKNHFIVVCECNGKISASCEVSIVPSLTYFSSGTAIVSGMCYESEKNYDQLCLVVAKIKEITFRLGCKKTVFLNENCGGFLNSVYMSSGLHRESCYAK
ncbi:MAG: hypothetical protein IJS17_03810 [Clostridia bacterium]|nr:hypothetical protein [Clostridia bacterium]